MKRTNEVRSDNNGDRQIEEDAPIFGAKTRITVSIEPEAAVMLDELVARLSPALRPRQARAEVIEQGIRIVYRRTFGKTSPAA